MSGTSINQNYITNLEPHLKDLLDLYKNQSDLDFNCHHLGTIQLFNPVTQTVQVTINYTQTYWYFDEPNNQYLSKNLSYPIIADCPLIVIGGGGVRITFPIAPGDQCILLFNDRDIDNWFNGSLTSPNATPRLHSFADCVALVGPNNLNTVLPVYDPVRATITNGVTSVGINPSSNKLTLSNGGGSLGTILQNLCTQLQNLTAALAALTVLPGTFEVGSSPVTGTSGVPTNASTINSIGTAINGLATQIGNLIE